MALLTYSTELGPSVGLPTVMIPKPKSTSSLSNQRERSSLLWFLTGFVAVFMAGLAKVALMERFGK